VVKNQSEVNIFPVQTPYPQSNIVLSTLSISKTSTRSHKSKKRESSKYFHTCQIPSNHTNPLISRLSYPTSNPSLTATPHNDKNPAVILHNSLLNNSKVFRYIYLGSTSSVLPLPKNLMIFLNRLPNASPIFLKNLTIRGDFFSGGSVLIRMV